MITSNHLKPLFIRAASFGGSVTVDKWIAPVSR